MYGAYHREEQNRARKYGAAEQGAAADRENPALRGKSCASFLCR